MLLPLPAAVVQPAAASANTMTLRNEGLELVRNEGSELVRNEGSELLRNEGLEWRRRQRLLRIQQYEQRLAHDADTTTGDLCYRLAMAIIRGVCVVAALMLLDSCTGPAGGSRGKKTSDASSAVDAADTSGSPDEPCLDVQPKSLDFGEVHVNNDAVKSVLITNCGTAPLTIHVTLPPDSSPQSTLPGPDLPALGRAAAATVERIVRFDPVFASPAAGTLLVESAAISKSVILTGVGTDGCIPSCQPGWECGSDGCGGICGSGCEPGVKCIIAKHACEIVDVPAPPIGGVGGKCGRVGSCQPTLDGADNAFWPACVNMQCESGQCTEPVCTSACTLTKDSVDAFGAPGPDGVDDPDAAFNSCGGADDGPLGKAFKCVAVAPLDAGAPSNICKAGTTFQPCKANGDCPGGETCQLEYILGEYSTRCATAPKASVGIGQYCNMNPDVGPVTYCSTGSCFSVGCVGFCKDDGDCGGWSCAADLQLYGAEYPEIAFDTCWPGGCDTNSDCGAAQYCQWYGNGKSGDEYDWANVCTPSGPGSATLGEECEADPEDNIPLPDCAGPCLNDGTCSALCLDDGDCAGAAGMLCSWSAVGVDFEDDGEDDKWLPLGLCADFSGTQAPCADDAGCGGSEACDYYAFIQAGGQYDAKGICAKTAPGEGAVGDACGGNSGVICKSGFCLSSQGDQPGFCTAMCSSKSDCPQNLELGLFSGVYNMACYAYLYSPGFDGTTDEDSVYVPLCRPALAEASSLSDCSESLSCPAGEACQAWPIAMGATGPAGKEFLCTGAGVFDGAGVFQLAEQELGEHCDILYESDSPFQYCKSNYCLPDVGKEQGYCGALCSSDADCAAGGPAMICDPLTLIDRPGANADVTVDVCKKQASCIPCSDHVDCTGDYVCVNAGGVGLLANYRCAPPCSQDADCLGTDGGSSCEQSVDKQGKPEGVLSCTPDC